MEGGFELVFNSSVVLWGPISESLGITDNLSANYKCTRLVPAHIQLHR